MCQRWMDSYRVPSEQQRCLMECNELPACARQDTCSPLSQLQMPSSDFTTPPSWNSAGKVWEELVDTVFYRHAWRMLWRTFQGEIKWTSTIYRGLGSRRVIAFSARYYWALHTRSSDLSAIFPKENDHKIHRCPRKHLGRCHRLQ